MVFLAAQTDDYQMSKCELLYFLCSNTKSLCQLGQDLVLGTYERIYTQKETDECYLPSCKKPMHFFSDCLCVFSTRIFISSGDRAYITPCWDSHYKTKESDLYLALLVQWLFQNKFIYLVQLSYQNQTPKMWKGLLTGCSLPCQEH